MAKNQDRDPSSVPGEQHVAGEHLGRHDTAQTARQEESATLELREEELTARKQSVEAGQVRVGTQVTSEQQTIEVPVRHDEVTIERHAVNRRPADGPIGDRNETISVPLTQEQVSVDKQAVVYEEVNVGKQKVQETKQVSGTVRREVVDVDAEGDVRTDGQQRQR